MWKLYTFLTIFILKWSVFTCDPTPQVDSLKEQEKSGQTSSINKDVYPSEDLKSRTSKREFSLGLPSSSGYGGLDGGRYGPSGGYPYDDRRSNYDNDIDGRYPGYIRPSAYGPGYDPPPPPRGYGPIGDYPDDPYYQGHGGGLNSFKMSGFKKILLPLAGLAILGVAAAASQNPVLLQLGSVTGKRRRRRSLWNYSNVYPLNPVVKTFKRS
ncbi:hypothetical protein ABEB36_004330 [Hypothenemus hampei]|uniref:Uncharacterized protein n=1 Tax=Hypothenemus hampei TaxID=57062 RepID=A0ABD1F4H4_HYPHA